MINLCKTFVKNKDGYILYPPPSSVTTEDTNEEKLKIKKLEKEMSNLSIQLEKAKAENLAANERVKHLKTDNKVLKKKNDELLENIDIYKKCKGCSK